MWLNKCNLLGSFTNLSSNIFGSGVLHIEMCPVCNLTCFVRISKKRVRDEEEGSDSLPLSKRITLLHLDSNTRSASLPPHFSHLYVGRTKLGLASCLN